MAALEEDVYAAHAAAPARAPRRQPAARPQLDVVRPRRRVGRYYAAMLAMTAMGVFGCVALNALAAEQSFAVRELEAQVTTLARTADELTVEVTRLESPQRIEKVAKRRLGMVRADMPAFLVLPGAASPESNRGSRTMAASAPGG